MSSGYQNSNRMPSWADESKNIFTPTSGIYVGLVKKLDTGTRSGRLWVYVKDLSTVTSNDEGGWIPVNYASPFMGRTLGPAQSGAATNVQNDFFNTQQSYGFFMSLPDVGNYVLCCFPGGQTSEGYWFACVNPTVGKQMIPSLGGLPADRVDPVSVPPNLQSYIRAGTNYPVGEFNENDKVVITSNWATSAKKPLHVPQFVRLITQGLDTDANGRGVISSSVQRDPVSGVYGFSTPGRPSNDPANDPDLSQKLSSGNFNPADFVARNRVGGHSLTLDDGDLYGNNNLVKLKTAAGHQILMNDTPGDEFLYIANSNGTAWIELTKDGDILVYGAKDLSIRTRGNLMMHSDSNIMMNAKGAVDIKSQALRVENKQTIINSEQKIQKQSKQILMNADNSFGIFANEIGITAQGDMSLQGSRIDLNGGSSPNQPSKPEKLNSYDLPDAQFVADQGWTAVDGLLKSINYRVPTHEPYVRGSIAAVVQQQTSISSSSSVTKTVDGNLENPIKTVSVTDTLGLRQRPVINSSEFAPASKFISQPEPVDSIGSLDLTSLRAYLAQNGYSNSNSNYNSSDDNLGQNRNFISGTLGQNRNFI